MMSKSLVVLSLLFFGLVTPVITAEGQQVIDYHRFVRTINDSCLYYEITEIVDLGGKKLVLPEGATIVFKGGRFQNGTIVCRNTVFNGRNGISDNVKVTGNVLGPLDISIFILNREDKSFDIGKILNRANKICKSIIVPEGRFYIQTPVQLTDIRYYQQHGDILYNGLADDITVIQFYKAYLAVIDIMGRIAYAADPPVINYTTTKRTNIVGVEFVNINNCNVFVNDVEYFNNNIRISAYGAGNCYNKYTLNMSVFSNEHVRIFQKDSPLNQIGWCNENIFIGGRFCNWSYFDWNKCESVAIRIEGATQGDTYNGVNSLLFLKPCMEGFKRNAVYAKNVIGCHWQDVRTEDTETFIKFVGDCRNNEANTLYGSNKYDYSESMTYPLKVNNLHEIYSTTDSNSKILEIDTRTSKIFKVVFTNNDAKARIGVVYLSEGGDNKILQSAQSRMMRPRSTSYPHSYYFNSELGQWLLASDASESEFVIPNDVTKVRLLLTGKYKGATIYSDKPVEIIEQ